MLLAMIVAGCSEGVAPIDPVHPDNVIDQDIYSDVPIEFGYGGMTKAPLTDLQDATYFGLFSVKDGSVNLLQQNSDIRFWNQKIKYENDFGFRFYENGTQNPRQLFYYYPKSDEKYSFYAYYTLQEESFLSPAVDEISTTDTKSYVKMYAYPIKPNIKRLLGNFEDVLWSKAQGVDPETGEIFDAFNASSARKDIKPSFVFSHPMSMLRFSVELASPLSRDLGKHMISVDYLVLMNSPCEADLCIIDLEEDKSKNAEGKFENLRFTDDVSKAPFLRGLDDSRTLSCKLIKEDQGKRQPLGKETMVVVPQKDPIRCRIRLSNNAYVSPGEWKYGGHYFTYEIILNPFDYVDKNSALYEKMKAEGCFLPGYIYNFNIVVDFCDNKELQTGMAKVNGTLVEYQ